MYESRKKLFSIVFVSKYRLDIKKRIAVGSFTKNLTKKRKYLVTLKIIILTEELLITNL